MAAHFSLLALFGERWLSAVVAAFSTVTPPPAPPVSTPMMILAPPPGDSTVRRVLSFKNVTVEKTSPGAPVRVADSTDIAFDADDSRQLLPVLQANDGLIVFVSLLDREHPKTAFRPDGSRAPPPSTLEHWVRIRLANPSWWPEVDRLCAVANGDGEMEAMAVFPPSYRSRLGAVIQARVNELKSPGRVVMGVGLRLEAGRPAGVVVRAITFRPLS
jgi:hypothetical protein